MTKVFKENIKEMIFNGSKDDAELAANMVFNSISKLSLKTYLTARVFVESDSRLDWLPYNSEVGIMRKSWWEEYYTMRDVTDKSLYMITKDSAQKLLKLHNNLDAFETSFHNLINEEIVRKINQ